MTRTIRSLCLFPSQGEKCSHLSEVRGRRDEMGKGVEEAHMTGEYLRLEPRVQFTVTLDSTHMLRRCHIAPFAYELQGVDKQQDFLCIL